MAPWDDAIVVQVEVDTELVSLLKDAEEREFATLTSEDNISFSSPGILSPYELGGFTPLSTGSPTPSDLSTVPKTTDVLNAVSATLADHCQDLKRPRGQLSEDEGDAASLKPPQQSRKAAKSAKQKEYRRIKRRMEATTNDVLQYSTPDVRPQVAAKYDNPQRIRATYADASTLLARSADVGPNRPAARTHYDFDDLVNNQRFKYVQIDSNQR